MHILANFNSFSRSGKPILKFNTCNNAWEPCYYLRQLIIVLPVGSSIEANNSMPTTYSLMSAIRKSFEISNPLRQIRPATAGVQPGNLPPSEILKNIFRLQPFWPHLKISAGCVPVPIHILIMHKKRTTCYWLFLWELKRTRNAMIKRQITLTAEPFLLTLLLAATVRDWEATWRGSRSSTQRPVSAVT